METQNRFGRTKRRKMCNTNNCTRYFSHVHLHVKSMQPQAPRPVHHTPLKHRKHMNSICCTHACVPLCLTFPSARLLVIRFSNHFNYSEELKRMDDSGKQILFILIFSFRAEISVRFGCGARQITVQRKLFSIECDRCTRDMNSAERFNRLGAGASSSVITGSVVWRLK